MEQYSEILSEAMNQIMGELQTIDPYSLDRQRLYQKTNTAVVANIKKLAEMDETTRRNGVGNLFREQLNKEIMRNNT